MAHKNKDSREFEDADTAEISEIMAKAFGDEFPDRDLSDVEVVAVDLSTHTGPADEEALEPGFILNDRFEIAELVHAGGMGLVYKAIDHRRHKESSGQIHVAIKMMRRSVTPEDTARLALEREASKAQYLSHPNIVKIFDFDEHDGQLYLIMEWLEGESVNALLRRASGRRLEPRFAWPLIEGAAAGLQHAHLNNVVHADINPSNIFITTTQEVKLLDFGVARYCDEHSDSHAERFAWATRTYASPQVLSGETPEFEDDIFSLGCIAYRLLSGTHPFHGVSSIEAQRQGVTVQAIPGLAEDDWQILSRALSYARSERPSTASVFLHDRPPVTAPRGTGRRQWLFGAAAATLVLFATAWWLWSSGLVQPGRVTVEQPGAVVEPVLTTETASPQPTELDRLLTAAAQAMAAEQYILPEDDNARSSYQQILILEPAHPVALSGLREISDVYVQQADQALQATDPETARAALAIAVETDERNPAIAVVEMLLRAQGDRLVADARIAAAEGEAARATDLLTMAARYEHIDAAALDAIRQLISQAQEERDLLERVAIADDHISAGRLITPTDGNAHSLLLGLNESNPGDMRLQASMERLGERLLTRAAFAIAAGEFAEAGEMLDAVETLGVLAAELGSARVSLQRASDDASVAATTDAELQAAAVTPTPDAELQAAGITATTDAEPQAAAVGATTDIEARMPAVADDLASGVGEAPAAAAAVASGSAAARDVAASVPRRMTMADLRIEKYVAPEYPRSARRRGRTGYVDIGFSVNPDGSIGDIEILGAEPADVFETSATRAISQWRFAPREDAVRARVTLRFEQPR